MLEALGQLVLSNPFWTVFVLLLVLIATWEYRKWSGLPPGPYGLPLIGYVFFLDRAKMSQQTAELCKKYKTDILHISSIGSPLIVLNTYELMKECFQKRTDLADRMDMSLFKAFDESYTGVIATSGGQWQAARRFSISMLRDFGMGRIGAEQRIQYESAQLCKAIKEHHGQAFDPKDVINIAVSNIICGMVFGQRYDADNVEFRNALDGMNELIEKLNNIGLFIALRHKFLRAPILRYTSFQKNYDKMRNFVQQRIDEHKRDYNGEVTDLIHGFLKDVKMGNHEDVFDDDMLRSLIIDYFFAGSETTYTTLRWCLLALAANPDMQKRIQNELDNVIGERDVKMSDKKETVYTEAFLCEIQRHYTLVPLGAAHSTHSDDVTVNGYKIPVNSIIVANLRHIHHDPQHWKNPDVFDPENFLKDGKLEHNEKLIPFGLGRRACAGEALARMELYMFFACLVKNFDIKLETDQTKADLDGNMTAVFQPKPFKVRMTPR